MHRATRGIQPRGQSRVSGAYFLSVGFSWQRFLIWICSGGQPVVALQPIAGPHSTQIVVICTSEMRATLQGGHRKAEDEESKKRQVLSGTSLLLRRGGGVLQLDKRKKKTLI